MPSAHSVLQKFADALEAKSKATNQDQDDTASDELIEAFGDVERNAAEIADLLRHLLSSAPVEDRE